MFHKVSNYWEGFSKMLMLKSFFMPGQFALEYNKEFKKLCKINIKDLNFN